MINVLLLVAKENRESQQYKDLTKQLVISDLLEFGQRRSPDGTPSKLTRDNVSLTAEDFMLWTVQCDLRLMQPLLDLIFELCHIVFGLWPQCKHMENDIVRGWLRREERRPYRVGHTYIMCTYVRGKTSELNPRL